MKRTAKAVLGSPVLIGSLLFVAWIAVSKLLALCCRRRWSVRSLPLAGLCDCGLVVCLVVLAVIAECWVVLLLTLVAVAGSDWPLLDLVALLACPARRRAVLRAIARVEAEGGPGPIYRMVHVVGHEPGRRIVSVAVESGFTPPGRRYFAVGDDGSITELDFDYVADVHGVRAQY